MKIQKFRKKPVEIEAVQWDGSPSTVHAIQNWAEEYSKFIVFIGWSNVLEIPTLEGTMRAHVGDWIIRGVKDEFYPCKPDIFEATYELLERMKGDDNLH